MKNEVLKEAGGLGARKRPGITCFYILFLVKMHTHMSCVSWFRGRAADIGQGGKEAMSFDEMVGEVQTQSLRFGGRACWRRAFISESKYAR